MSNACCYSVTVDLIAPLGQVKSNPPTSEYPERQQQLPLQAAASLW